MIQAQTTLTRPQITALLLDELRDMDVTIPDSINDDTAFKDDLGIDSLGIAEFVARMEQTFRVEISDDDWHTLYTLGRAADYIESRLGQ